MVEAGAPGVGGQLDRVQIGVRRPWWDRHGRPVWLRRVGATADYLSDLVLLLATALWLPSVQLDQRTALVLIVAAMTVGSLRSLYLSDPRRSPFDRGIVLVEVMVMALAATIVAVAGFGIAQPMAPLFVAGGVATAVMIAKRALVNAVDVAAWRRGIGVSRTLFIGAEGESTRRLMQAVVNDPRLGAHLVGYLGPDLDAPDLPVATERRVVTAPMLGTVDRLEDIARRFRVDEVILTLDPASWGGLGPLVERARAAGLVVRVAPQLGSVVGSVRLTEVAGVPVIGFDHDVMTRRSELFKRAVDLLAAGLLLAVAVIPMVLIALAIRLDSPGPVLLAQPRVGLRGRPFAALKFRTMVDGADRLRADLIATAVEADPRLFKHAADPRLTRVGEWLRRWSLDELPQVWNVARGEMSIVGPRPPLPEEVALYEPAHLQRLAVTPGLTGLWQVNGRSDLSFEEMIRLDLYYVETWSPWLDLKLMVRTVPAVIGGRGAY